jgi:hypothetical protein
MGKIPKMPILGHIWGIGFSTRVVVLIIRWWRNLVGPNPTRPADSFYWLNLGEVEPILDKIQAFIDNFPSQERE